MDLFDLWRTSAKNVVLHANSPGKKVSGIQGARILLLQEVRDTVEEDPMGTGRKASHQGRASGGTGQPKSLSIAEKGVSTSKDFRNLMSAIMSDVIAGRITPHMTNAACNAGGKMLKMVDLEMRYGTSPDRPRKVITIAYDGPKELKEVAADGRP